jgi:hypothetical protein
LPLPGTQIQATRGACCLFLVPSGRCKCLLNQLRWVFRLECYKTRHRAGCSPVSHSVSIRRLARHLTKQTQMRPLQKDICAALCGLADAQDTGSTRGGRGWGRSSQRGASGVGGGALHMATTLLTPCTPSSPLNSGFLALKSHSQDTCSHCKKLWQDFAQYTSCRTCARHLQVWRPPGERPTRSPRRRRFSHHQICLTSGFLH